MQNDAQPTTLSSDEFIERAPPGWNVFEARNRYARQGFRYDRAITRALIKEIGDGEIPPEDLPVACDLPVTVAGLDEDGALVFDLDDEDEAEVRQGGALSADEVGLTKGPKERPSLTRRYLREHRGIAWDYRDMKDVYAVLGYNAAIDAARELLDQAACGEIALPQRVHVTFLVNTTPLGGGCRMVCIGDRCNHFPNDSSNAPGS